MVASSPAIFENTLDGILIQEPFAKGHQSPTIINIPPGYVAFHCLSQDHVYGAAVLVKLSLAKSCRAIACSRSNHIAEVDLHSVHGIFRFISVYTCVPPTKTLPISSTQISVASSPNCPSFQFTRMR
jgi:hypothetical protein